MQDSGHVSGRRNPDCAGAFRVDGTSVDRTALLAQVAEAASTPTIDVQIGFADITVEVTGHGRRSGTPLAVARFTPAHAFTLAAGGKDAPELQTAAAVALGLRRWTPGAPPQEVDHWLLRVTGDVLELLGPKNLRFSRGRAELPDSWREAVAAHGRALVIYGPAPAGESAAQHDPSRQREPGVPAELTDVTMAAGLVRCVAASSMT